MTDWTILMLYYEQRETTLIKSNHQRIAENQTKQFMF